MSTDGADYTAEDGRKVGIYLGGGGERGGEVWANGNLHLAKSEYGHTVYCDATNYGPLWGGEEEAGAHVGNQRWERAGVYLAGAMEMSEMAAEVEKYDLEE